jgi:hypothetical protein
VSDRGRKRGWYRLWREVRSSTPSFKILLLERGEEKRKGKGIGE